MKTVKIIIITLTSVILLFGLGYFGVQGFAYIIYNQRTCEWANIDNIELHAQVDIPGVVSCDCKYQKEQNTKMAYFDIDKNNFDMNQYIQKNNLRKLKSATEFSFDKLLNIESNIEKLLNTTDLYYLIGTDAGENWKVLLDKNSGRLWVTIKYKE